MKTPAKIAQVQIVRKAGRWGGYKLRMVTEGGRVLHSHDYDQCDLAHARVEARRLARFNAAELVDQA